LHAAILKQKIDPFGKQNQEVLSIFIKAFAINFSKRINEIPATRVFFSTGRYRFLPLLPKLPCPA